MNTHGSYKLEVDKHTVTFIAYDAWNYEAVKEWGEEFKKIVVQMNNEPWVCLVDLREWELGIPETGSYLSEIYLWLNNQNLNHLAVVFGNVIQKGVLEKTYKILTNVEIKYFEDTYEAKNWLNSISN